MRRIVARGAAVALLAGGLLVGGSAMSSAQEHTNVSAEGDGILAGNAVHLDIDAPITACGVLGGLLGASNGGCVVIGIQTPDSSNVSASGDGVLTGNVINLDLDLPITLSNMAPPPSVPCCAPPTCCVPPTTVCCVPPTTCCIPTTTVCCTTTTTSTSTTVPSTTTTVPSTTTTVPTTSSTPTTAPPSTVVTRPPTQLPTTGSTTTPLALVGGAALVVGGLLLLASRRGEAKFKPLP